MLFNLYGFPGFFGGLCGCVFLPKMCWSRLGAPWNRSVHGLPSAPASLENHERVFPTKYPPKSFPFVHRIFRYVHHPFWVVFPPIFGNETPIKNKTNWEWSKCSATVLMEKWEMCNQWNYFRIGLYLNWLFFCWTKLLILHDFVGICFSWPEKPRLDEICPQNCPVEVGLWPVFPSGTTWGGHEDPWCVTLSFCHGGFFHAVRDRERLVIGDHVFSALLLLCGEWNVCMGQLGIRMAFPVNKKKMTRSKCWLLRTTCLSLCPADCIQ